MAEVLVVVRSGETEFDPQGRIRGNLDVPLTPAGRETARTSARALAAAPPAAIYTSPAACARATAAMVAEAAGLVPRVVPALAGLDLGLWQGMLAEDLRRRQPRLARHWADDPWTILPPGGECPATARERVVRSIAALLSRHPRGRVAVVVPQPVDRIVRAGFEGGDVGNLWDPSRDDDGVVEIRLGESAPVAPGAAWGGILAAAADLVAPRGRFRVAQP